MKNSEDLEKIINSELTTKINNSKIKHDQLYINIDEKNLMDVIFFLKTNSESKFRQLIEITAVDYPEKDRRFKVVYLLLSHENNKRIIVDYNIKENEVVSSITSIFPSANWMEREVFDMYGIEFKNHPDLRRILTDYDFKGYPLRKDFPLTGKVQNISKIRKKINDKRKKNIKSKLWSSASRCSWSTKTYTRAGW